MDTLGQLPVRPVMLFFIREVLSIQIENLRSVKPHPLGSVLFERGNLIESLDVSLQPDANSVLVSLEEASRASRQKTNPTPALKERSRLLLSG
jgi:hypothetical protein